MDTTASQFSRTSRDSPLPSDPTTTTMGPVPSSKLALFRRASVHVLGVHHSPEIVDPPVRRVDLQLEHRPTYNNFALRTVVTAAFSHRRKTLRNSLKACSPGRTLNPAVSIRNCARKRSRRTTWWC